MATINEKKELAEAPRPVVLMKFTFPDASTLHVSTHDGDSASGGYSYDGVDYLPMVKDQAIGQLQRLAESGVDRVPSVSTQLADPDAATYLAYERAAGRGFKGASVLARLVLFDPETGAYTSDYMVPFVGVCDPASWDSEVLSVSAATRSNYGRYMLPSVPIQENCPWINPATAAQRLAAGVASSKYYPCGETRDLETAPPCRYTKATCTQPTHFGGCTYSVKNTDEGVSYLEGKKSWRNADTSAKYRDYWPLWLGGRCWLNNARAINVVGDPNYTRGEVSVGFGPVTVERVIVNGEELSYNSGDYPWHYVNQGARAGTPNADVPYNSQGDPYGNCTVIQVRTPGRAWAPDSEPSIQILGNKPGVRAAVQIVSASASNGGVITVQFGRAMGTYDPGDGNQVTIEGCGLEAANGTWTLRYTELPYDHAQLEGSSGDGTGMGGALRWDSSSLSASGAAPTPWLIAEALSWCDVADSAIDVFSFTDAAEICLANGFCSAMVLRDRRSAAEIIRGLCQSIGAILYPNAEGKIAIRMEGPLAEQQPAAVDGSNYNTPISSQLRDGTPANGYAAYRFDASNSWDLQRTAQRNEEMPNRVSFPFQDPEAGYAVSTFTLIDSDDVDRVGREIPGGLQVQPEGVASYGFAKACATLGLNRIHRGNNAGDTRGTEWWTWKSSFRGCRVKAGDLVLLHYPNEGLSNQLIRVTEVAPSRNYETVAFKGYHHSDAWYLSAGAVPEGAPGEGQPNVITIPGDVQPFEGHAFGIAKTDLPDGSIAIAVEYDPPDPITRFTGVVGVIERADGSYEYLTETQYDGDPAGEGAARRGTARWIVASPGEAEDWYVSLVSCSATGRNTFYPHGAAAPSPYRTLHVTVAPAPGTVPPVQPSAVALSEIGPRVPMPLGRTATTLRATLTGGGASAVRAEVRIYKTGAELHGQTLDGPVYPLAAGHIDFAAYVPTAAETWTAKVSLASATAANAWSTAVESGAVEIAAIGPAGSSVCSSASLGGMAYDQTDDGVIYWGISSIQWTLSAADVNAWTTKLTVQRGAVVGGVWTPDSGPEGVERSVRERDELGQTVSMVIANWDIPPADAAKRTYRFRLYARSRAGSDADAWILQTTAWSGADHADVTPASQAGALDLSRAKDSTVGAGLTLTETGLKAGTSNASNLVQNPGFEDDLAHWTVATGAASVVAGGSYSGTKMARIDASTTRLNSERVYCIAGQQFRATAQVVSSGAGVPNLYLFLFFEDASGTIVGTALFSTTAASVGGWKELAISHTAPAGSSYVRVQIYQGTQGADFWYVDHVALGAVLPGTQVQISTEFTVNATTGEIEMENVDMAKASNLSTQFALVGGKQTLTNLDVSGVTLTGALSVGGPGMISQSKFFDHLGNLLGFIGDDRVSAQNPNGSGFEGFWFKGPGGIGGADPLHPKVAFDSSGNVAITASLLGCSAIFNQNSHTTRLENHTPYGFNQSYALEAWNSSSADPANGNAYTGILPGNIYVQKISTYPAGAGVAQMFTSGISGTSYGMFRLDGSVGAYYLWVDASGRLRIKSGSPTSDTDGTVVGAQS